MADALGLAVSMVIIVALIWLAISYGVWTAIGAVVLGAIIINVLFSDP